MSQYLRKVKLTVGGLSINHGEGDQLKVGFDVSKDLASEANDATIEVWNLSEGHRNSVGREFEDVRLEAGYLGSSTGIIFVGQIRDVEHARDKADIITRITCGDGDKGLRNATSSKSFPAGTPIKDILEQIQKDLEKQGVSRGQWRFPDGFEDKKLKRPFAMCGSCQREMNMFGRSFGFYWSIQNGATELVSADGAFEQTVFLSSDTGLVNTPTITDNGVKFEALLNPEIRPNRRVQIQSQVLRMNSAEGTYRVSQVNYRGDNRAGEFVVSGHCELLQDNTVDEGIK